MNWIFEHVCCNMDILPHFPGSWKLLFENDNCNDLSQLLRTYCRKLCTWIPKVGRTFSRKCLTMKSTSISKTWQIYWCPNACRSNAWQLYFHDNQRKGLLWDTESIPFSLMCKETHNWYIYATYYVLLQKDILISSWRAYFSTYLFYHVAH